MQEIQHVAVFDFGSQYTQLIVRRIRELGFFAKLYSPEDIAEIGRPGAIILSGGPKSTSEADAPDIDFEKLKTFGVPVLGVCYGMQLLNIKFGGSVKKSDKREYGAAALTPICHKDLYDEISEDSQVWMSHSDTVQDLHEEAEVIATNQHGTPVSLRWPGGFLEFNFTPRSRTPTKDCEFLRISSSKPTNFSVFISRILSVK